MLDRIVADESCLCRLMTADGSMLASSGEKKRIAVTSAIAANMWSVEKQAIQSAFKGDDLHVFLAQTEVCVVLLSFSIRL